MNLDVLHSVGRVLFGAYFIYSGVAHFTGLAGLSGYAASKKVPFPKLSVIVSGVLIVLGGLGVAFNYHLALSLLLIIVFLVPVTFFMHNFWADTDPSSKMNNKIAFMKNMAIASACLMLL